MKVIQFIWRFLGSIYLAIILIFSTAIFALAGTCIEAQTDSHACAAHFTYSSFIFSGLLWGYFINILISALQRWPFQRYHFPFLMTHLGLLMLLAGALSKIYWGTQGSLALAEGSGTSEIILPSTYALLIESPSQKEQIPLKEGLKKKYISSSGLTFRIVEWYPHSKEKQHSWIKDNSLSIKESPTFTVKGNPYEILKKEAKLKITAPETGKILYEESLVAFLEKEIAIDRFSLKGSLDENTLTLFIRNEMTKNVEEVILPITGILQPLFQKRSEYLLPRPFLFELETPYRIVFHDAEKQEASIIHPSGKIIPFNLEENEALYSYADGYRGYAQSIEIPSYLYKSIVETRKDRWSDIEKSLNEHLKSGYSIADPVLLFKKACEKQGISFPTAFTNYLNEWQAAGTWLNNGSAFSNQLLQMIDWQNVQGSDIQLWKDRAQLFEGLQTISRQGIDVVASLKTMLHRETDETDSFLGLLDSQSNFLNQALQAKAPSNSLLFSAALRDAGITPEQFLEEELLAEEDHIRLESQLQFAVLPEPPPLKWEDHRPGIILEVSDGRKTERIDLHYDKYGTLLKHPILQGRYLLRFQSFFEPIPYRIRLLEARQINYPGTVQPLSYEADIRIKNSGHTTQATLSMNNVYETWDGYRFYLANCLPGTRNALQHVQIVVNRDPTKYFLIFPGFLVLSTGVFMLLIYPLFTKRHKI